MIDFPSTKRLVSSAKSTNDAISKQLEVHVLVWQLHWLYIKSFMYNNKSKGPRTDPCGTPSTTGKLSDR